LAPILVHTTTLWRLGFPVPRPSGRIDACLDGRLFVLRSAFFLPPCQLRRKAPRAWDEFCARMSGAMRLWHPAPSDPQCVEANRFGDVRLSHRKRGGARPRSSSGPGLAFPEFLQGVESEMSVALSTRGEGASDLRSVIVCGTTSLCGQQGMRSFGRRHLRRGVTTTRAALPGPFSPHPSMAKAMGMRMPSMGSRITGQHAACIGDAGTCDGGLPNVTCIGAPL